MNRRITSWCKNDKNGNEQIFSTACYMLWIFLPFNKITFTLLLCCPYKYHVFHAITVLMFIYNHCLWCHQMDQHSAWNLVLLVLCKTPDLVTRFICFGDAKLTKTNFIKKGSEIECYLSLKQRSIWDFRVGMFFWVALHTWHLRSSDNRLLFPDISSTLPTNSAELHGYTNSSGQWRAAKIFKELCPIVPK